MHKIHSQPEDQTGTSREMLDLFRQGVGFPTSTGTLLGKLRTLVCFPGHLHFVRLCCLENHSKLRSNQACWTSQCGTKCKAEGTQGRTTTAGELPGPGLPIPGSQRKVQTLFQKDSNLGKAIWFPTNRPLTVPLINFGWCLGSVFTEKAKDAPHKSSL